MKMNELNIMDPEWAAFDSSLVSLVLFVLPVALIVYLFMLTILRFPVIKKGIKETPPQSVLIAFAVLISMYVRLSISGIVAGFTILLGGLILYVLFNKLSITRNKSKQYNHKKFQYKDNRINMSSFRKNGLLRDYYFADEKNFYLSGELKSVYPDGSSFFKAYTEEIVTSGLVIPESETEFLGNIVCSDGLFSCKNCGNPLQFYNSDCEKKCRNCGQTIWSNSVMN